MQQLLAKYSPREQKIIILIVALFVLWFAYFVILSPLLKYQQRIVADYQNSSELLAWTEHNSAYYKSMAPHVALSPANNSSVVVAVESIIEQYALGSPLRIEPQGTSQATVQFDAVEFDSLIRALGGLKKQGIDTKELNISASTTMAMVSATIVLERK